MRRDGEPCQGRPRAITDHLYRCPVCGSHQWKRPTSKNYPNGEHVIFGWTPEGTEETNAVYASMWELIGKLAQREKMIDWYERHATKIDAEKRALEGKLRAAGLLEG